MNRDLQQVEDSSIEAKLVLLGNSNVGKTSICAKFVFGEIDPEVRNTIGASFLTKKMKLDGVKLKLQLWDTAGQERFRSMAPMYYRGADMALCVFDVTNLESFESMKGWVDEVKRFCPKVLLCICGNKADLVKSGQIPRVELETALKYAGSKDCKYFETSALTGENIEEVFLYFGRKVIELKSNENPKDKDDDIIKAGDNSRGSKRNKNNGSNCC